MFFFPFFFTRRNKRGYLKNHSPTVCAMLAQMQIIHCDNNRSTVAIFIGKTSGWNTLELSFKKRRPFQMLQALATMINPTCCCIWSLALYNGSQLHSHVVTATSPIPTPLCILLCCWVTVTCPTLVMPPTVITTPIPCMQHRPLQQYTAPPSVKTCCPVSFHQ